MKIKEEELKSNPSLLINISDLMNNEYDYFEFCYLGGCEMLINCMNEMKNSKLNMFLPLLIKLSTSFLTTSYCCCFGLIPILLKMFDTNDQLIQVYVISFLSSCAFCDENVKEIVKYNGLYKCITIIRWTDNMKLRIMSCVLLSNLCGHFGIFKYYYYFIYR